MEVLDRYLGETDKRFGANVTVDPLAYATPVDDPEIVEIHNLDEGAFFKAKEFIGGHLYQDLVSARLRIRERLSGGTPQFACAWCGTPAYIVATPEKHFFFRHIVEDGSCPAETRNGLTEDEIRARKYHGLRESGAHLRIKALIERCLIADPDFHTIFQERMWRSARNPRAWRQPDVQATSGNHRFAFEVQLSTTFLDVVVGRRVFYRGEGAQLIWVLGHFSPEYRRLTTDDLLFSNNSNVFVVDEETTRLSEAGGKFQIRCFHRRPFRSRDGLVDKWQEEIVPFSDLTFEQDAQRAFYFDYGDAARILLQEIEQERAERRSIADEELRKTFFDFWREAGTDFDHSPESFDQWNALRSELRKRNVVMPIVPNEDSDLRALLNALFSVETGQPVGWQFRNLIEVGHHLAERYPQHVLAFGYAVEHFNRKTMLQTQDTSLKWKQRCALLRTKVQERVPEYMPRLPLLPVIQFLFPPVGERLLNYVYGSTKPQT